MKANNRYIFFVAIIGLLNLLLIYFIKYSSNHLSIIDFNITKTGNLINLFITVFMITGCLLLLTKKIESKDGHFKFLSILSILYLIPLILVMLFNLINFKFAQSILFGYPLKKIIPIILYLINQLLFFYIIFIIWFIYFGQNMMAYLYSILAETLMIVLFLFVSFTFTFMVTEHDYKTNNSKYDFGIILGAAVWRSNKPSPVFTGRIDKGAALLTDNVIERIQLTGGHAPGEVSEARAAYNYLRDKYKLPANKILMEELTSTTNEQIRFIKNKIAKTDESLKYLFISDHFHLQRIAQMADFYNLNAKVISSEYKLNFQKSLYYRLRDSVGLILFWLFAI